MTSITVGPGKQHNTIGAAVAVAHAGDTILVDAGTYPDENVTINTNISLMGVGGFAKMISTRSLANDKAYLVINTDCLVDHFEFFGAKGPSGNDAGIRYQAGKLTCTSCYLHDNQNGILGAASDTGQIMFDKCEFANNGIGDGFTHNIYVGAIELFVMHNCYVHDVNGGNEVKSRATITHILGSRIYDNQGVAGYSVDISNGGEVSITGCVIQQSPSTAGNSNIISFAPEGAKYPNNSLSITDNIIINDMPGHGALVLDPTHVGMTVTNNHIWRVDVLNMPSGAAGTVILGTHPTLDTSHPWDSSAPPMGVISASPGLAAAHTKASGDMTLLINNPPGGNKVLASTVLADIYVVTPAGGSFEVTGFQPQRDKIDVSGVGVVRSQFAARVKFTTGSAGTTMIVGNTTLLIRGVAAGITENNFLFGVSEENVVIMQ